MVRIFTILASIALILVAANLLLGMAFGDFNQAFDQRLEAVRAAQQARREAPQPPTEQQPAQQEMQRVLEQTRSTFQLATMHRMFGVLAALMAILVNSVTVTYFIGTSRWCREVVDAYGLDPQLAKESARIKRKTFPYALGGMLVVVGLVASGGAADPASGQPGTESWVPVHLVAAWVGLILLAASFWIQLQRIGENYQVIERILAEVQQIRAQRKLDET